MTQDIEIRDRRNKEWFIVDNEYLNGYAKIFGPVGTSVYLSLCRHADSNTQECYPSMELIAEEIGISRQTVSKYISMLNDFNLIGIEVKYDSFNKQRLNNVYTLINKKLWREKPCQTNEHGSNPMLNSHQKPCQNDIKSHVNQFNSNNTQYNNTNTTILTSEIMFLEFWMLYPNKVKKSKSIESWNKLTQDEKELAIKAIKNQVENKHFTGNDGKDFPPHPTTWLNQKRWEDEVKIKTYGSGTDLRTKK